MAKRYSIYEFNERFKDEDSCLDFLFAKVKPNICPCCKKLTTYYRVKSRKCYECGNCGHQIYPMKGTIFENSRTSLKKWFDIINDLLFCKNGISAMEVSRKYGLTYKTAWSICHKIRVEMVDKNEKQLMGVVEMDESYLGNQQTNDEKSKIFGMIERDEEGKNGRMRLFDLQKDFPTINNIQPIIKENIKRESKVYTDKGGCYTGLSNHGFIHKSINHKKTYKYNGGVHTNSIEGFWGRYKMSILGTHRWVSDKWRQNYLNEFSYRYNCRKSETNPAYDFLDSL